MNMQIAICAAGAAITALFIVWAFVRAARRPFMKSAPTARERIGADRSHRNPSVFAAPATGEVSVGPGPQFARGGRDGKGGVVVNTGPEKPDLKSVK